MLLNKETKPNLNTIYFYGLKYSYQIEMILKPFSLNHRWGPNRYYISGSKWTGVFHIPQISRTGASAPDTV